MIEDKEIEQEIEISRPEPVTEDSLNQIRKLLDHDLEEIQAMDVNQEGYLDRLEHGSTFKEGLNQAKIINSGEYGTGFVQFAKKDNKIVGFAVCGFDKDNETVNGTYIGVDWNEKGKGMGTRLFLAQNEELKRRGVKSYVTGVWEGSLRMIERSGVRYESSTDEYGNEECKIYLD